MPTMALDRALRVCCAQDCREPIDLGRLACPTHWCQLSPRTQREWREAWSNAQRGVPASLGGRARERMEAQLISRLISTRRRATRRIDLNDHYEWEDD